MVRSVLDAIMVLEFFHALKLEVVSFLSVTLQPPKECMS